MKNWPEKETQRGYGKVGPDHALLPLGRTGFYYCYRCMHIRLKNTASRERFKKPCTNGQGWE